MQEECRVPWTADNGDGTYTNPILYADYSDPDAIRVGEDYYMVASSFCNTPAVPVLHSKDLVNWTVISYAMERLPFASYDKPRHGCGAWAPSIRFHEETFYIFIPMPDEGIFMVKSKDPFAGWEEPVCVHKVTGWIDPCPFWDEDGSAYMVSAFAKSRIGFKSILHLSTLSPDTMKVSGEGKHIFDGSKTQPTIEGPKLYKRDGYYYIFAPAGGVKTGWQTVLRSENIWGPYEEKIVMRQGSTDINGPHQGAWVDTPSGEDWFLHFQDVGNAGRIVHLQPMHWVDGWPVIGADEDGDGCGEPVLHHKKPNVGGSYPVCTPAATDYFQGERLGLQWQWNANCKSDWYALQENTLILYAQRIEPVEQLCNVPNLLLQKWPAPDFTVTIRLDFSGMREEDVCGIISLGSLYTAAGMRLTNGKRYLIRRDGEWQKDESELVLEETKADALFFRIRVEDAKKVSFFYSEDGEHYKQAGEAVQAAPGRWVGVKAGLFAISETNTGGFLKVKEFVFSQ